jgi:hypothetical protein
MNMLGFLNSRNKRYADYYGLLRRIHSFLKPATYVEIGVRHGTSLQMASTAHCAVGIDPDPQLAVPLPPSMRLFRMTSDEFFAKNDLTKELGGHAFNLAFIDGMHLFEYVLRDFINLERAAGPGSVILAHDCYPINRETAQRERATDLWSGDVWKLVVCLKKYRPDLELRTVDVPPTGLAIIRRLSPASDLLASRLEDLYSEFVPLDYGEIETDKAQRLNRIDSRWSEIEAVLSVR